MTKTSALPTHRELQAMMRLDFYLFLVRAFKELNGADAFLPNWYIEVLAAKLQGVFDGKIKRLIINLPPRSLKSLMVSVAFTAYWHGHRPGDTIINVSYAQELTDKFARDTRAVINSPFYQGVFPTRLQNPRSALQELTTTQGGSRIATSTGGVLTGRGAELIIIDDPQKPADVLSQARRAAANDWFDNTLYSRLNSKVEGAIVIVMQRLHEDDLVGHVLQQEGWTVLSLPAIAEADESYTIETPHGRRVFRRKAGEALHPALEPLEVLHGIRATIGAYLFAAQYQQTPAPAEGGLVQEDWFRRVAEADWPQTFNAIIQSWDTANKPTQLADYSVCTTWGSKAGKYYLINVFRAKLSYPQLKNKVIDLAHLHNASVVLIEDRSSGTQLIQDLSDSGFDRVKGVQATEDKIMRLSAQSAKIENGSVLVPEDAFWLGAYLHEMTVFPNGRHDDQVDSTSQALAWMSSHREPAWITHLETMKAKQGALPPPERRVKIQNRRSQSTHVQTLSGELLMMVDGCIEVKESDAPPLLAAGFERVE